MDGAISVLKPKRERKEKTELESRSFKDVGRTPEMEEDQTIEDERGLTIAEVRQLDALYVWLMKRRANKRGYVLWSSGQNKPR